MLPHVASQQSPLSVKSNRRLVKVQQLELSGNKVSRKRMFILVAKSHIVEKDLLMVKHLTMNIRRSRDPSGAQLGPGRD